MCLVDIFLEDICLVDMGVNTKTVALANDAVSQILMAYFLSHHHSVAIEKSNRSCSLFFAMKGRETI
jgi:hypothetical protein